MTARTEQLSVLFVDVADSTKLLRQLGDAKGRAVVVEVLDLMQGIIEAAGGQVIDRIGDELMCTLPSAAAAYAAAISVHEQVSDRRFGRQDVQVRLGFHHGPVSLEDGAIFGDTVHTARRMASTAKGQQIVTTTAVLAELASGPPLMTRLVGRLRMAGHEEPVEAHEVVWNPADSTTMALADNADVTLGRLLLHHGSNTVVLGAKKAEAVIGREPSCDIIAMGTLVSRRHARIEVRDHHFVLVDMSTNGTSICWKGAEPLLIKRAEAPLRGSGQLRFGPADGPQDVEPIEFEVRPG
jgi:adenylate cyclase